MSCLRPIDSTFPSVTFQHVTLLELRENISLKFETLVKIARCFPVLKSFYFSNQRPLLFSSNELRFDDEQYQSYDTIKFPYLTSLYFYDTKPGYIQLFLTETKIRLSNLEKLTVDYNFLVMATKNFTHEIHFYV